MSDPPRLLEGNSMEADLLDAWSTQRPSVDARAKALALGGLGVGASAVVAAKAATTLSGAKASALMGGTSAGLASAGGVSAGAGLATGGVGATAATTGAGLFAAKWIAALGIVAAVGGGTVAVKHYAAAAPTPSQVALPMGANVGTGAPNAGSTSAAATGNEAAANANSADAPNPTADTSANASPNAAGSSVENAGASGNPKAVGADARGSGAPGNTLSSVGARKSVASSATGSVTEPHAGGSKPAPASSLAAEVSSLDAARDALRSGQPSAALRELDAFDGRYPSSALSEDAAMLRFDSYVALGDKAGATRSANAFLAKYPSSPRAAKVRRWLDDASK